MNNETWMVFDIEKRKISFTFDSPNTKDSSVLIASSILDLVNNMPDINVAATPLFTPPTIADNDPFAFNITLIS